MQCVADPAAAAALGVFADPAAASSVQAASVLSQPAAARSMVEVDSAAAAAVPHTQLRKHMHTIMRSMQFNNKARHCNRQVSIELSYEMRAVTIVVHLTLQYKYAM